MPRVYLIFRNQIFGDSVRAILDTRPEIELVGMVSEVDQVAADVTRLAPDVILLEETEDCPAVSELRAILASPRSCRLIMLRLDGDGMHVWDQTWRQTVQTQDLVEAIIAVGEDTGEDKP